MTLALIPLHLLVFALTCTSQESCVDRCENGFDSKKSCQCDSMCRYYQSCCSDYEVACHMQIRGDTFVFAEDEEEQTNSTESKGRARSPEKEAVPLSTVGLDTRTLGATDVPTSTNIPLTSSTEMSSTGVPRTTEMMNTTTVPSATPASRGTDLKGNILPTTANPVTLTTAGAKPTTAPDPDADACSGRSFDAFLQLKNGTIFAFRGDYFFGLDERSVLPGYPQLIKDVWGISGPIDAAFTRINCQGKTYIFKGNKYYRYDEMVLDEDYPRDISVGFEKIPDDIDAAFSAPAHGHHGKEKVYFFKGDQYYLYEFKHQPSHEECIQMSSKSPSVPFLQYTKMYHNNWDEFYNILFGRVTSHHHGPHFISKDWKGLRPPIDAVMAGRLYMTPRPPPQYWDQQWGQQQWGQQWGRQDWDQQRGQQWGRQDWDQQRGSRRRYNRSPSPQWQSMAQWGMNIGREFAERGMNIGRDQMDRRLQSRDRLRDLDDRWWDEQERLREEEERWRERWMDEYRRLYDYDYRRDPREDYFFDIVRKSQPVQSVYFFKGDKYYRVDLKSKRVDPASPPYPRPIGKYWLGCKDNKEAERK